MAKSGVRTIYSFGPWQDFIKHVIKAALLKIFCLVSDKLPEPTKENTIRYNSHILIDLRDEFLKHEVEDTQALDLHHGRASRYKLFKGAWNFLIALYDFDSYYSTRIDWVLERWLKTNWKLRRGKYPGRAWRA